MCLWPFSQAWPWCEVNLLLSFNQGHTSVRCQVEEPGDRTTIPTLQRPSGQEITRCYQWNSTRETYFFLSQGSSFGRRMNGRNGQRFDPLLYFIKIKINVQVQTNKQTKNRYSIIGPGNERDYRKQKMLKSQCILASVVSG